MRTSDLQPACQKRRGHLVVMSLKSMEQVEEPPIHMGSTEQSGFRAGFGQAGGAL